MYHDVVAGDPAQSGFAGPGADRYKVPRTRFEEHLGAIASARLTPHLVGSSTAGLSLLLTFDDGGASAATVAAPSLDARGWPGHFFVTTERIGTPGFLTGDQLLALHEAGHIVGSHGTHAPGADAARRRRSAPRMV